MAEPADVPIRTRDSGDPDLQSRLDDLRLALRDWRRTREYSQSTQKRLEQLTLQCGQLVESWQQVQRRRAGDAGPGEQGATPAADRHGEQETGERIRALERAIEHEWEALPPTIDDPARQISEQAASLVESCVAAANLALRGFSNAESRLATLEREIQTGMSQLSRDLQQVLTELRSSRPPSLPGAGPAFPLEGVMRIHQEMRESDGTAKPPANALGTGPAGTLPHPTEPSPALAARVESLERAMQQSAADAVAPPRPGRRPWHAAAGLLVVLAVIASFGFWMQRRIDARLTEAALRVSEAERQRDATIDATRADAAKQVAEARQSADQAQVVGSVLAAPDLVRYWLTPTDTDSRAYAHVLISRSRGMVFSALRLEPPAAGRTYQLWLLTRGGPVNGGVVTPDAEGRVTLATDTPPILPGRLTGALVTLEPAGGRAEPSGNQVLVRAE